MTYSITSASSRTLPLCQSNYASERQAATATYKPILPTLIDSGLKIIGRFPISDFVKTNDMRQFVGIELAHANTQYAPATVAFVEQGAPSAYCLPIDVAATCAALMDRLSPQDRARVRCIAAMKLPEPDYSTWVWVSTRDMEVEA